VLAINEEELGGFLHTTYSGRSGRDRRRAGRSDFNAQDQVAKKDEERGRGKGKKAFSM
jgi:hypothetical protein